MASEWETVGLDPAWIAAHAVVDGHAPASAAFVGFIGTGQMSRNARFTLDWAGGDGPASVVVKVPSGDAGTRSVSFQHTVYAKECDFYRAVLPLVDVTVPAPLAVHFDPDNHDFAIVLEDLAGSEQGDQFSEPTSEQLDLAIDQLARLQAPVWGKVDGPEFDVYRRDNAGRSEGMSLMFPVFLETVFQRLGADLDPDVAALLERFIGLIGPWQRRPCEPATLVHGDFRPDNFMFGIDPTAPPLAVVDWQTIDLGAGVTDLAYLLGGALEPEHRRAAEPELLGRYRQALASRGVDYGEAECVSEYALATLHGIVVGVTATAMAAKTERGDALFTLMLNRHGQHALEVDALDRVEAIGA